MRAIRGILVCAVLTGISACEMSPQTTDDQYEVSTDECLDGTQGEMTECATQRFRAADRNLSRIYQELLAKLSPESGAELQAAEEAFITYRDKQCELETSDGSVGPMVGTFCLTRLTDQQTKSLEHILTCEEGDVSCVR